jgi:hypothetical protein
MQGQLQHVQQRGPHSVTMKPTYFFLLMIATMIFSSSALPRDTAPPKPATKSYWAGIAVGEKRNYLVVGSATSEAALEQQLRDGCDISEECHILERQRDGCVALVQDETGAFFSAGLPLKHAETQATELANDACRSKGQGTCKVTASQCAISGE